MPGRRNKKRNQSNNAKNSENSGSPEQSSRRSRSSGRATKRQIPESDDTEDTKNKASEIKRSKKQGNDEVATSSDVTISEAASSSLANEETNLSSIEDDHQMGVDDSSSGAHESDYTETLPEYNVVKNADDSIQKQHVAGRQKLPASTTTVRSVPLSDYENTNRHQLSDNAVRQRSVGNVTEKRERNETIFKNTSVHTFTNAEAQVPYNLEEPSPQRRKKMSRCQWLLIVVVAVMCISVTGLLMTTGIPFSVENILQYIVSDTMKEKEGSDETNLPSTTKMEWSTLAQEFPQQTTRFWTVLKAATAPVIEEEDPEHPAVILLVAPSGSRAVANCLARRYAQLVTETFHANSHVSFDCSATVGDPDDIKRQLDRKLSEAFEGGSKAGIVLNLEQLPALSAMIFYRFADNDNAPYKNVALVLVLTLQSDNAESERDTVAFNEIRRIWKSGLNEDKMEPLLARIGNSVAFVRHEDDDTLSAINC